MQTSYFYTTVTDCKDKYNLRTKTIVILNFSVHCKWKCGDLIRKRMEIKMFAIPICIKLAISVE